MSFSTHGGPCKKSQQSEQQSEQQAADSTVKVPKCRRSSIASLVMSVLNRSEIQVELRNKHAGRLASRAALNNEGAVLHCCTARPNLPLSESGKVAVLSGFSSRRASAFTTFPTDYCAEGGAEMVKSNKGAGGGGADEWCANHRRILSALEVEVFFQIESLP